MNLDEGVKIAYWGLILGGGMSRAEAWFWFVFIAITFIGCVLNIAALLGF